MTKRPKKVSRRAQRRQAEPIHAPPTVDFRYLTVHSEAIYLKAPPADALYPLRKHMHGVCPAEAAIRTAACRAVVAMSERPRA